MLFHFVSHSDLHTDPYDAWQGQNLYKGPNYLHKEKCAATSETMLTYTKTHMKVKKKKCNRGNMLQMKKKSAADSQKKMHSGAMQQHGGPVVSPAKRLCACSPVLALVYSWCKTC